MLEFDTTALLASLTKAHEDAVKRMKNMVEGFAYEFILTVSSKTPIGDATSLGLGESGVMQPYATYYDLYSARADKYGIDITPGYHKGAWQFSSDGSFQFSPDINPVYDSADSAMNRAEDSYRLGSTFYIGSNTPGMVFLEGNSSEQTNGMGIIQPTIDDVTSAFAINAQRYYQMGS